MDAESQAEIKARLVIAEFECSPEEITEILSISPTTTWLKGEPVLPRAKNIHKENGWILQSPRDPVNSTVDAQVESLLSIVSPHLEAFANLPSDVYIELACAVYVALEDYRSLVIGFSADTIRMLAKLGANIDIDMYALGSV